MTTQTTPRPNLFAETLKKHGLTESILKTDLTEVINEFAFVTDALKKLRKNKQAYFDGLYFVSEDVHNAFEKLYHITHYSKELSDNARRLS